MIISARVIFGSYIEEVHVETKCNLLFDVSGELTLQIRFEILRLTVAQHCLNVLTCCLAAFECVTLLLTKCVVVEKFKFLIWSTALFTKI